MLRASGVGFISRDGLLGSRSTGASRTAGIHSVIRAGAMWEGYLRHHPQTPATRSQASFRRHWTPAGSQLRLRAEAARGGWIHLLVFLGTARALSH
jgi:hypothetical protein